MAQTSSAKKRHRQNITHRSRNRWRLKAMRTAITTFNEAIAHGSVDDATQAFAQCQKLIDKTAQKGVIHRNQADRRKSRLSTRLKARQAEG